MIHTSRQTNTSAGPSLAFTFVVMGVFLSIFGTNRNITGVQIGALIVLGICYLFFGIYGFHICIRSNDLLLHYLYFAGQLLVGGALLFISEGNSLSPLLLIPLIGQSVMVLAPRIMILVNGVIAAIYFSFLLNNSAGWFPFLNSIPFYLAGQLLLILFLQLVGDEDRIHAENARLIGELESANMNLQRYASQVEELTITRERNRLAREIHDGVGHYLTVVNMQIQAARAVMEKDPIRAQETLLRAMNQTQEALKEIRESVSILREAPEEYIPLTKKLEEIKLNLMDSHLKPEISIDGEIRELPFQYEQTLLRIIQEGIQNCIKHANADKIWILLDYRELDKTRIIIRDNGVGLVNKGSGFGLISLQERVRLLDGVFSYGNAQEGGFFIEVEVPV